MTLHVVFDRARNVRPAARAAVGKDGPSHIGHAALCAAVALAASYAVSAPSARAQAAHASISRGEEVARSVCSACHQVAGDQEFPPLLDQPTPSFREIANRPGTSVKSLERFITMTHWNEETIPMKMPNPMLTQEDTVAVAHYILSLRSRGRGVP